MTRENLISELIFIFQDVLNFVDIQEEKAKEVYSENQLELVEEVWSFCPDFENVPKHELEEWFEQLEEMHYMY